MVVVVAVGGGHAAAIAPVFSLSSLALPPPHTSLHRRSLQLGLQTVPKIMHFPPAVAEGDGGRYAADPSQHMHMAGKVEAEAMARFVKERTGVSIPIVRWAAWTLNGLHLVVVFLVSC